MTRRMGMALAAILLCMAGRAAEGQAPPPPPTTSRPAGAASRPAPLSRQDLQRYLELQQQVAGLFGQKKYEEAAGVCRQLIQLAPKQPDGYYNLACALSRLGKAEEAFASLQQAADAGFS
jgi:tetratricopeptide (TPR) repeat protein